jgi:hypothetical protein
MEKKISQTCWVLMLINEIVLGFIKESNKQMNTERHKEHYYKTENMENKF